VLHDGADAAKSYASRNLLAQPKALDRHVFDARLSEIEIVSQGLRLPNRFSRWVRHDRLARSKIRC
jgi:hypothetical protein